LNVQQNLSCLV